MLRRLLRRRALARGVAHGLALPHTHTLHATTTELLDALDPDDLPPSLRDHLPTAAPDAGWILLPEELRAAPPEVRWRLAFHAAVHHAIEVRRTTNALSAAALRSRLHTIGQTEVDEARFVLRQENVLEAGDDGTVYAELAAVTLEHWHFDREALRRLFPTLAESDEALALFRRDVDDEALLDATRPEGAPRQPPRIPLEEPPRIVLPPAPKTSDPLAFSPSDDDAGAPPSGPRIRWTRALIHRVAGTGEHVPVARQWALLLEQALGDHSSTLDATRVDEVADALRVLAERATQNRWFDRSREARLLAQLERAAPDDDREIQAVDLLGSLRSWRRLPVIRTLPLASHTREKTHLRRALGRLSKTTLTHGERARVASVFRRWLHANERRLADAVRPRLERALEDVGLRPNDASTRVARAKLVDELIDVIHRDGFFGISQLRDALSRNELPLPGLTVGEALGADDPLLAIDRALTVSLDGVYRPGEVYLRALQKGSALAFGTRPGHALTTYVVLPTLGAFVVLEGLQHVVGPLGRRLFHVHLHLLSVGSMLGLSAVLFALLHSTACRTAVRWAGARFIKALSFLFLGLPRAIANTRVVRVVVASAPVRLLRQLVLKPLLLSSFVLLGERRFGLLPSAIAGGVVFLLMNVVLNTRLGRLWEERLNDAVRRAIRHLGAELLPGILRAVMEGFRRGLDTFDRILYQITESLHVRRGDPRMRMLQKGILGTAWALTAYIARLYVNVLVEPQVNPIKHFPVVTVSHKIILPLSPTLLELFRAPLRPLGAVVANAVAGTTVLLLPGAFGFLVWELSANFRLYGANRRHTLGPSTIGSHGETMLGFLLPGFHSGTVPKLHRKLRRAASHQDPAAEAHLEALEHVADAVARFVERELIALLVELGVVERGAWKIGPHGVVLAGNRVRILLTGASDDGASLRLSFEEQSGKLLADLDDRGLLASLSETARAAFEIALVGLYHRAGVSLSRQQIEALLRRAGESGGQAPRALEYDIADEGLVVWERDRPGTWVVPLDETPASIAPTPGPDGAPAFALAALPRCELVFGDTALLRDDWIAALSAAGDPARPLAHALLRGPSLLPRPSASETGSGSPRAAG